MTLLRKEDTAKALKLVGAIVAVFGCAAWRLVGATAPPASPPPAPETVAAPPASAAPAEAKAKNGEIEVPNVLVAANANPFRSLAPDPAVKRPAPLPGAPLTPLPLPMGDVAPSIRPVAPPPVPVPTPMRVSGIVAGPNATAVLEVGADSVVVRVGSLLPDGAIVARIDAGSVTLQRAGKLVILAVGD